MSERNFCFPLCNISDEHSSHMRIWWVRSWLGSVQHGLVQSSLIWGSPVRYVINKFKITSDI